MLRLITNSNIFTTSSKLYKYRLFHSQTIQDSIKSAINTKTYQQIPQLLDLLPQPWQKNNPLSFLFTMPLNSTTRIIDEMLQSFLHLRPRSRPETVYSCLLSSTLQSSKPLPLGLAVLQRTLRSGCIPVPQTHLLLSSAWLDERKKSRPVSSVLKEMECIGYRPDTGTCNYVLTSLCAVDELDEGVRVLRGMSVAGCVPDCESYGVAIDAMCVIRKTGKAVELMKEMVGKIGLMPSQGTLVRLAAAFKANKEMWKAVDMIEYLEMEGVSVGFESYELAIEGCLECREFVLAGKIAMKMAGRGFIPYIRIRQKVVEGLAGVDENELASSVRQRFAELGS